MTFSFSRLHLYEQCPYAFYKRYIEEDKCGEDNFYAENGSLMHEIFKKLLLGDLSLEKAPGYYQEEFECICSSVKQSTMNNTFDKCIDYLCTVDPFESEKYEIIDVEKKIDFKIGKYNFVGYPDLIIKSRANGEVILVDHKSADHFLKSDGSVLKNKLDDFIAYSKQMYMYCKAIKDTYNMQVNKIVWHHFKDGGALTSIKFNQEDYEKTLGWCNYIIDKIKKDKRFEAKKSYMMCKSLCDFRNTCEYQNED